MSDANAVTGSPHPPDKPAAAPSAPPLAPAAAAPAAPAAPPKPAAAPAKPAPAKSSKPGRRFFMFSWFASWFAFGWLCFIVTQLFEFVGTLRFLYPNVLNEPPSKEKAGFPDDFEEGKVVDRFKDKNFWIVRYEGKIIALSTTCTHLGCTPNYLEREGKFKCPCHGSGFYGPPMGNPGINFEGPAPRPLERWAVSVGDDGQIVVDKSRKFQYERGEWSNPDSFIKV